MLRVCAKERIGFIKRNQVIAFSLTWSKNGGSTHAYMRRGIEFSSKMLALKSIYLGDQEWVQEFRLSVRLPNEIFQVRLYTMVP